MNIELLEGDITACKVDAVVNAANNHLWMGAGVAGAIKRVGGDEIEAEAIRLGPIFVGEVAITGAGRLPARHVIHAVGPKMGEGDEDAKLKSATVESMKRAAELGLMSIAFPAISTGIFGYPMDRCARVMIGAALDIFHSGQAGSVMKVVFCLWGAEAFELFKRELSKR